VEARELGGHRVGESMMRHSEPMRAASRLLLSHPIVCLLATLAAVVVVLGVLGPIRVVQADEVASQLEGENFANKPTGTTVVSDTLFSGGRALKFTADVTASHPVTASQPVICSAVCDVVLMARAGQSGGRPSLSVNGSAPQAITTSNQVAPEPYTFDVNLPEGFNEIRVTASGTGTGHNAFLDVASFPADGGGGTPPALPLCADGEDNDGDGQTDHPADPGCLDSTDNDEIDSGATQAQIVPIPCGKDIDATINNTNLYPRSTPQRFVLGADCTFTASAPIVPSDDDVVACAVAPTFVQLTPASDPTKAAWDPNPRCTVAGSASVENVFRPIGQGGTTATVRFEGIKITGGNFTGSSGTGTAIAEGSMTDLSSHYGIEVRDNDAAGINGAKGTFERVEFTNNTIDRDALGFIASGMKALTEVEVKNSYIHDTQGNGLWCDEGCVDGSEPTGFYVHHNLVVDNDRAGIRYENSTNAALIENNEVHGNSYKANRGGVSVHDAQDATVRNNVFGPATIANVSYEANAVAAIRCSDSGRSDRPNLQNVVIGPNVLNGETIKDC
jgi:hypothetical protein